MHKRKDYYHAGGDNGKDTSEERSYKSGLAMCGMSADEFTDIVSKLSLIGVTRQPPEYA